MVPCLAFFQAFEKVCSQTSKAGRGKCNHSLFGCILHSDDQWRWQMSYLIVPIVVDPMNPYPHLHILLAINPDWKAPTISRWRAGARALVVWPDHERNVPLPTAGGPFSWSQVIIAHRGMAWLAWLASSSSSWHIINHLRHSPFTFVQQFNLALHFLHFLPFSHLSFCTLCLSSSWRRWFPTPTVPSYCPLVIWLHCSWQQCVLSSSTGMMDGWLLWFPTSPPHSPQHSI